VVTAPKIRHDDKGKIAGICREKRKEIRWRVQLQSLIFLIRCGKNPVIYADPDPLSSFQCPSSIQSLNLALFDSVLGPKCPSNQSRELGQKSFSRSGIPAFNTRYSNENILSFWYWNQVIQKPKFIYVSRTTTLMRIQSEINLFWITELQPNSAGNRLAARFYVFTLDFKQEYLEFLISELSNSKAQIHLRVLEYKIDERVEVR